MFKSKKRLFCFLIAVILVITASTSAFAASPNETKYNNTVMASSSASISDSGLLTVVNQFQGIRGKTTKGEITTYVEKKTLGFFWTRVDIGQPNNQWYDVIYNYLYDSVHIFQLNNNYFPYYFIVHFYLRILHKLRNFFLINSQVVLIVF